MEIGAMTEGEIQRRILRVCSVGDTRLFRNNIGMGWVGTVLKRGAGTITLTNARPFHAGLCAGSSDLIGWTTRYGVSIFTAIEVKKPGEYATDEQERFLRAVKLAGGRSGIAASVEDARRILEL